MKTDAQIFDRLHAIFEETDKLSEDLNTKVLTDEEKKEILKEWAGLNAQAKALNWVLI